MESRSASGGAQAPETPERATKVFETNLEIIVLSYGRKAA
jgi:hypothetical protein